jgi:hypothetical protein
MPGLLVSIDVNGRVVLPAEMLAILGWSRKKLSITAELGEPGVVRVYKPSDIDAHIHALSLQASELDGPARRDVESVLADRYRPLTILQ